MKHLKKEKTYKEIEVEEVPSFIIKPSSRLDIDEFSDRDEVGGVIMGYKYLNGFMPVRLVQVKNAAKQKESYVLPGYFSCLIAILKKTTIKELICGLEIIGEWHSHMNQQLLAPSKGDEIAIQRRVKQYGFWILGLVVPKKGGNRLKMAWKVFKANTGTLTKK